MSTASENASACGYNSIEFVSQNASMIENCFDILVPETFYSTNNLSTTTELDNFTNIIYSAGNETKLYLQPWYNFFEERYLRHSFTCTVCLTVAYLLILVTGVIGNVMVILVVLLRPQMKSVTNMFIMNLAVADLFVILFCVPVTLLSNVLAPWILGEFMCKAVAYVQGVSVGASAYSLVAVSIDRCKAIYQPCGRPSGLSKPQAVVFTCFIWSTALLLTIPWVFVFTVKISEVNWLPYCTETWENENYGDIHFVGATLICGYFLPLFVIFVANAIIWYKVKHRPVPTDSTANGSVLQMHQRSRQSVVKMLGVVTLTFTFSWFPLYCIATIMRFFKHTSESYASLFEVLLPMAQWLGSSNSCVNPILYAFLNKKFRQNFKSILPRWLQFISFVKRDDSLIRLSRRNAIRAGTIANFRARNVVEPVEESRL